MRRILFVFSCLFLFSICSFSQNKKPLIEWVKANEHRKLKSCIDTLKHAIEISHQQKAYDDESAYLQKISNLFLTRLKNFNQSMEYIEKIKKLADETGKKEFLIDYYNQLGVNYYYEQLDMPKSFSYFKKALDLFKELNLKKNISRTLNNYGLAYLQKENYTTALNCFREAISSYKTENNSEAPIEYYTNMGVAYIYAEKYDSAEFYFLKSYQISQTSKELQDDAERLLYLGVFYQETGKNKEAADYLKKSLDLIDELNTFNDKIILFQGLADLNVAVKQFEQAYYFRDMEKKYRDSLRIANLAENALSYQYKSELDSLKNLNKIQSIEQKQQSDRFQSLIIIIILSVISVISIFVMVIFRFKNKQRKLELINEKEKLEKLQVQVELENNEREVTSKSMFLLEKDNLIRNISQKLNATLPDLNDDAKKVVKELVSELNFSVNNKRWDEFELRFNKVHPNFYANLEKEHPKLSSNERKLCAFLLMNMSSKDISSITGQTVHSINIARGRLRNKLKLVHSGEELTFYLSKYAQQS
jgi:tetratricopeptide (TPR) repeat protein/DNA-binding CsgD family transcriptional regulator